jgi:hypothetical protein
MARRRRERTDPDGTDRYLPTQHWQEARNRPDPPAEDAPLTDPRDAVSPVILLPVGLFAAAVATFCVGAVLNEMFFMGGAVVLFVVSVFALFAVPLLRMLQDQQPPSGPRRRGAGRT